MILQLWVRILSQNASGTVSIRSGKTVSIPIPIIDDASHEGDETFTVTLSNPQNATLSTTPADHTRMFTIGDSDTAPALSIRGSVTAINAVEGESADIGLVLANPTKQNVVVGYTVSSSDPNETASAGDYSDTNSGSITLSAGTTFKTLSIGTVVDSDYEDDETFTVTFDSATNTSNTSSGGNMIGIPPITVTIIDDESVSTLTATASVTVTEGSGGTTNATINLSLSPDSTTNTVVLYSTVDGTAKAGTDYTAPTNGMVPINTGVDSGSFDIVINPDSIDEDDEVFYVDVTIQNPGTTRAKINGNAIRVPVTITDDDNAPVLSLDTPASSTVNEGDTLTAGLTLVGTTSKPVSVTYTIGGTASADDFIDTASGVASITSGQTGAISIPIIDDNLFDENETIIITIANTATNASVGTNKTHTFTITDNDAQPELSTPAITVKEDKGAGKYPLFLNRPATASFQVRISPRDNSDLKIEQQTITFAPGDLVKSFDFMIKDDTEYEPNGGRGELQELDIITILNSPSHVNTAGGSHQSTGIIWIVDNDSDLPVLSAPKSISFVEGQSNPAIPLELSSAATGNS